MVACLYPGSTWFVVKAARHTQVDVERRHPKAAPAEQSVATLSGGERARAWLAMCIAQDTPYLLLDEPLAPLDIVYQVEILRLIRDLARQKNKAIVIIIHDINLAAQFCDEFIALKNGKLCHVGDIASTMQPQVLDQIFGINLHLLSHPVTGNKVAVV